MSLQSLFGVERSIIQAPMAGSQGSALAIAVCNAGGLGSLPCAMLSIERMRVELAAIKARTDKPFNVNFFCHTPPTPNAERELKWRALLAPYYERLGLAIDAIPAASGGREPFGAEACDVLAEFQPAVVSFHFGLPSAGLVARLRGWGARVMSSATTVAEARWLEARGVDAIIAQGLEAGGHRGMFLAEDLSGQLATFALLKEVLAAVRVPVIPAGGISDAQGVQRALASGAAGVQIGTSYLLCPEATTSAVHRAALQSDQARRTAVTNLFTGRLARGIVNRVMSELGPVNGAAPAFPLAASAITPLRVAAEAQSAGDFSPLWSGQNANCRAMPAGELTRLLCPR